MPIAVLPPRKGAAAGNTSSYSAGLILRHTINTYFSVHYAGEIKHAIGVLINYTQNTRCGTPTNMTTNGRDCLCNWVCQAGKCVRCCLNCYYGTFTACCYVATCCTSSCVTDRDNAIQTLRTYKEAMFVKDVYGTNEFFPILLGKRLQKEYLAYLASNDPDTQIDDYLARNHIHPPTPTPTPNCRPLNEYSPDDMDIPSVWWRVFIHTHQANILSAITDTSISIAERVRILAFLQDECDIVLYSEPGTN